jgi:hypothetical protein
MHQSSEEEAPSTFEGMTEMAAKKKTAAIDMEVQLIHLSTDLLLRLLSPLKRANPPTIVGISIPQFASWGTEGS